MDAIKLGQVTNADVYLDGAQMIGRITKFSLEGVSYKLISHEALGMIAQVELPGRVLEALKAKLKIGWLDADVMRKLAFPNKVIALQLQNYVDVFDSSGLNVEQSHRLITSVDFLCSASTADELSAGEGSGEEHEISVTRIRITTSKSTVPIREISVFDNINRADGVDVWPTY